MQPHLKAQMAELVDAYVSGAYIERCAGSIPVLGTKKNLEINDFQGFFLFHRQNIGKKINAYYHHAQSNRPPQIMIPETTKSIMQKPIISLALSLAIAKAGMAQNG